MKKIASLLLTLLFISTLSHADEGMWLLNLVSELNITRMHDMGCKLTADEIYSINHSSLKDGVVIFGEGCTAEVVSAQGLIFTNHHCGYEAIQYFSSVHHDYLDEGYWAGQKDKELHVPNLTVTFLVRIEDVTSKVLEHVTDDMPEAIRDSTIKGVSGRLEDAAVAGTPYKAKVTQFYGGNNYYLFVYEVYKDIRLVGAPPSSIGKFGGETDNWMWPRQTGDFSIFRIYADSLGNPAPYSLKNIPLKPKMHFTISLKGVKKDDFAMIMGYPGRTQRYMTSYGVKELLETDNPSRIKIRGVRQNILMNQMMHDPALRIEYADKFSKSANYWKFSIGEDKGLNAFHVIDSKKAEEQRFMQWVDSVPSRKVRYGDALSLIRDAISFRKEYHIANIYIEEALFNAEALTLPMQFLDLYRKLKSDRNANVKALLLDYRLKTATFFKDYDPETDKKVAAAMFKLYCDNVNPDLWPGFLKPIRKKYKGNYNRFVDALYHKSIFVNQQKITSFLNKPSPKILEKDPIFKAAVSILNLYLDIYSATKRYDEKLEMGRRLYIAGRLRMEKNKIHYPDANFTMRLTYGRVEGYDPRDAVHYDYFTTLKGVMEKEEPDNVDFQVPDKLKKLYYSRDFGRYGDHGRMHVCFITNNDISGGNSGSPVLNAQGQLIGLAFDGNWEAMSGNVVYEPSVQRTICVDIRYVLFIIDKFANAQNIIKELTIAD